MKQRVAHIVQKMAPGGLEALTLELAGQLPGEHSLISLEGDAAGLMASWPRLGAMDIPLIGMGKRPGLDFTLVPRLASQLRRLRIEAVFTHHAGPFVYGGLAARLAGLKSVYHVEHDVWHYQDAGRVRLMRAVAALVRPKVIGVAERMREPLRAIFPRLDIDIIANGVALDRYVTDRAEARARLGVSSSEIVIGAVGRLETVKGHDILIEALARMSPTPLLIVVGDGSQRSELAGLAQRLGVADRVRWLGHRDDVASLLASFDVFCQPSRNEGLPLAVLEAQAAGAPVVATDVGDLARAVCPATGRLVPPENPEALAAALAETLRVRTSRSPRAFVAAHFDINQAFARYSNLLEA